jgi:AraC family transcriptional regulator, transcriptional activator of the genes for pyochelin and ferripyochelin receptors
MRLLLHIICDRLKVKLGQDMAIAIDKSDYDALWAANNHHQYSTNHEHSKIDIIYDCPAQLGRGYEEWVNLRGISLLIINQEFHDNLLINYSDYNFDLDKVDPNILVGEDKIEFGFNLFGTCCGRNFDLSFLEFRTEEDDYKEEIDLQEKIGKHLLKVDIHLNADLLRSFAPQISNNFPKELQQLLDRIGRVNYEENGKITPEMKLLLRQIIHCPFEGMMRQMYLEGKCLELMAFKLVQLAEIEPKREECKNLSTNQIDQIYQAKEILTRDLNHPPSLLDLARQVSLNDCDLKRGFRQVFGTTVFGYLYNYRMMEAKRLLEMQHLNINEVARAVGYDSRSTFSGAFKKKFGVSPNNYLG